MSKAARWASQEGDQLGLVELVVDGAALRQLEHRRRQGRSPTGAAPTVRPRARTGRCRSRGRRCRTGAPARAASPPTPRRRAPARGSPGPPAWCRSSARTRRRTARRRRRWHARACLRPRQAARWWRTYALSGSSVNHSRNITTASSMCPALHERARVRAATPLARRQQQRRLARGGHRLGDPGLLDQQERQVVPGVAERRRDLDRAPARRFAFRPLPAPAQQAAQVRQRLRALGELDAAPEGALRLVGLRAGA